MFINVFRHYVTTPDLAFSFVADADSNFWTHLFEHIQMPHLQEGDYTVDGRRYSVYAHNFRVIPLMDWLVEPPESMSALAPIFAGYYSLEDFSQATTAPRHRCFLR